jgi:3',5'-cyclic-AMP phosphodiesterase
MNFSFVQITDHHLRRSEALLSYGYSTAYAFRAVMRHIAQHVASRADFIVTTGDLVDGGEDAEYQALGRMLDLETVADAPGPQRVSIEGLHRFPMYFLPGNHDPRLIFYRHLFPAAQPQPAVNVTFEHKGVRFICLDWGAQNKAVAQPEMLGFLAQALQTEMPAIILMHHHPVPVGARWLDAFIADDVEKFWDAVVGHNVLGVFFGHTHTTYEAQVAGIPAYGLRSTTFSFVLQDEPLRCLLPPHYRLVTIQDGRLSTRIYEVPL